MRTRFPNSRLPRLVAALLGVATSVAVSEQACAEVDQEKFYPISISCPANPSDELVFVAANAAGRYTRGTIRGGRITLAVRNGTTNGKFRVDYDVAEDEIDGLPDERSQNLVRKGFRDLRQLKKDICDGTSEYFGRYQRMLEDNRRITGTTWPIPE